MAPLALKVLQAPLAQMVNQELQAIRVLRAARGPPAQMVNQELQALQALKEQPEARAQAALIPE